MVGRRGGGTNALHATAMVGVVVVTALIVGYVAFDLEGSVLPEDAGPDASFEFSYDAERDRLVVAHRGGDALNASRVVLLDDGFEPVGNWTTDGPVSAGDSATVTDVTRADTVHVAYRTDDGAYVVLATWNEDAATTRRATRTATFLLHME